MHPLVCVVAQLKLGGASTDDHPVQEVVMPLLRYHCVIGIFLLGFNGSPSKALSGFPALPGLETIKNDRRLWQLHPFGRHDVGVTLIERSRRRSAIDLDTAMARLARGIAGFNELSLVPSAIPEPLEGYARKTGTFSRTYEPRYAGIAFCGMTVRAHVLNNGDLSVFGVLPELSDGFPAPSQTDWPSATTALERLLDQLASRGDRIEDARIVAAKPCWQTAEGTLKPAWRLRFSAGDLPYSGTADDDVAYRVEERYFSISGSAKVYQQNSSEAKLSTVELLDLKGDGTLNGQRWRISVPAGIEPAFSTNHQFDYEPSELKFVQPNLYYHLQLQQAYMASIGYEWPQGRTLQITPHMNHDPAVGFNNAFFQPTDAETGDLGQIKLGDGDGVELKELGVDADVVAHEFGHQVVYTTLKTAARCYETLALHEGLADFFAFARTQDACLGESICPEGTGLCIKPQCLRSGELDIKYGDASWLAWSNFDTCYAHKNGQLFSSMLWDLRTQDSVPHEDLARLVFKAVTYFREDSGFRDFLLTLFMADAELYQGRYHQRIKAGIEQRGLGKFVQDVTANDAIPALAGGGTKRKDNSNPPTVIDNSKKDQASKKATCGTVTTHAAATCNLWSILLIPGLLVLYRRCNGSPQEKDPSAK